jgi:antitoxin (DNA-binding transcriptional repressor) of toxin-antitoxin stability system
MQTYSVGNLKTNFSEILKLVRSGEQVAIAYGKKRKVVAYLVPRLNTVPNKRPLGLLEGTARTDFTDDFKITETEFLGHSNLTI